MENTKIRIPVFKVAGVSFHKQKVEFLQKEIFSLLRETLKISMIQML